MSAYYASLIGPLDGLYFPLPDDLMESGMHPQHAFGPALNSSRLSRLWCSIYTREKARELVERFGGTLLPDTFAGRLDYDHHAVYEERRQANAPSD